nr:glycosyltransferase [uncultured Bacteroides sp.]
MTLTFITNLIIHHQVPVADEFYQLLGKDYTFVATQAVPDSFIKNGYPDLSDKPYLLKAYESRENYEKAMELAEKSDVVVFGISPLELIVKRLKQNKLTFIYSERLFKDGYYHLLSPRVWLNLYNHHIKYRNKNVYMLCSSAYTAFDVSLVGAYPDKCLKWAYFTKIEELDIEYLLKLKSDKDIQMLWVARFLNWKHPEMPVKLARRLKDKGYKFIIRMAGSGEFFQKTKNLIEKLNVGDCVSLIGNMPNDEILALMQNSHIFIFTSDRNEGWGAVLNEAMSNGCAVVASNMIGAAPYLIKQGENGYIFKSGDVKDLTSKVEDLINNPIRRNDFSRKAYQTLKDEWSPINAAHRFLLFSDSLIKGISLVITEGPCSKAEVNSSFKV